MCLDYTETGLRSFCVSKAATELVAKDVYVCLGVCSSNSLLPKAAAASEPLALGSSLSVSRFRETTDGKNEF